MRTIHLCVILLVVMEVFAVDISKAAAAPAKGPLKVHPKNPRYFTDGSGKAIYLTGFHNWWNLQDVGTIRPPSSTKISGYDFSGQLKLMEKYHHNFMRMWVWEQRRRTPGLAGDWYVNPLPWALADESHGKALDGMPKFDLARFNQAYFDRLRERAIQAREKQIYVSIMLFQGFSVPKKASKSSSGNPWHGHPFNHDNNINGADGDLRGTGEGLDIHILSDDPKIEVVRAFQEAYIKKVIDTINDLDNVLYEIGNEMDGYSRQWQYHMIDFIKGYESKHKPKQHPVGMTFPWPDEDNEGLFSSSCHADWISPGPGPNEIYKSDPPPADGGKVSILDTDHLWGIGGDRTWVWKSFTRGHNPIYMDPLKQDHPDRKVDAATMEGARIAMGDTLRYAERMNLAAMTPSTDAASTGYALVNTGWEYLVFQPDSNKPFTVKLKAGSYKYEWFNPATGKVKAAGEIEVGDGDSTFNAPFEGEAVLYLKTAR